MRIPLAALAIANMVVFVASSESQEVAKPKTFGQMVAQAHAEVQSITPAEARELLSQTLGALVIDVRDAADIPVTGMIPNAINISLGTLTYKADNEVPEAWRDSRLQDRSKTIVTTCYSSGMAALAGKLLKDMGFSEVRILAGGTVAWKEGGYAVE